MKGKAKIRRAILPSGDEVWAIQCRNRACWKWSIIEPGAQMRGHKPVPCLHCRMSVATCDFESAIARMKLDEKQLQAHTAEIADLAIALPTLILP